jgi:hypothetical protein
MMREMLQLTRRQHMRDELCDKEREYVMQS